MIDAQRLVWPGYGGSRQRIYLIRLVPEPPKSMVAQRWADEGELSVATFQELITQWVTGHNLACKSDCEKQTGNKESQQLAYHVDVGITFEGLKQLRLPPSLLDVIRTMAPAFSQGAHRRATQYLGDAGPSDPSQWESRYCSSGNDAIHAILFVHEAKESTDKGFLAFERSIASKIGLHEAHQLLLTKTWIENSVVLEIKDEQGNIKKTGARGPFKIHFDMLDGISTPRFLSLDSVNKSTPSAGQKPPPFALGEFLLGYAREDGSNNWIAPSAHLEPRGSSAPHRYSDQIAYGKFFRNGTFGAFRKMRQDVKVFDEYLVTVAKTYNPIASWNQNYAKAWLKAKMLGRWANGDPILPQQHLESGSPGPSSEDMRRTEVAGASNPDNQFDFSKDLDGLGCPYGAHIRRMNPRKDPVVPFLRRPLVRRGVPYGKPNTDDEKGLLGLFLCASLEEQFEHLLGNWASNNPMGLPLQHAGRDPIIGNHEPCGDNFEIPLPRELGSSLESADSRCGPPDFSHAFVDTRGTCYLLFPSVSTLTKIANGRPLDLPQNSAD